MTRVKPHQIVRCMMCLLLGVAWTGCGPQINADRTLSFSQQQIDFEQVVIGQSDRQTIVVENTGNQTIWIESIEVEESKGDEHAEVLLETPLTQSVIKPGEKHTLNLVWTPLNLTADFGKLVLKTRQEVYKIPFQSPLKRGKLTFETKTHTFEPAKVGKQSFVKLHATNTGMAPLRILSVTVRESGDDRAEEIRIGNSNINNRDNILQPSDEWSCSVFWGPKNIFNDQAVITIEHTEGVEQITVKAPDMSVPAVPQGTVELSSKRLLFTPQRMAGTQEKIWTVTNTSTKPVELGRLRLKPDESSNSTVELVSQNKPSTLLPGQSRDYIFRWSHNQHFGPERYSGIFSLPVGVQAYALDQIEVSILAYGVEDKSTQYVDAMTAGETRRIYNVFRNPNTFPVDIEGVSWSNPNGFGVKTRQVEPSDFQQQSTIQTLKPGQQVIYESIVTVDSTMPVSDTLVFTTSEGQYGVRTQINRNTPILYVRDATDDVVTFGQASEKQIDISNDSPTQTLHIRSVHITNAKHASFLLHKNKLPQLLSIGASLHLEPGEHAKIPITYDRDKPPVDDAFLTIQTNDPRRPNLKIRLRP